MSNSTPPGVKPATLRLSNRKELTEIQKAKLKESNEVSKERLSMGTLIVWQAPGDGVVVGAPPMSGIRFRPLETNGAEELRDREAITSQPKEDSRLDFNFGNWRIEVRGRDLHWLAVALSRFEVEDLTVGEGQLLSLEQVEGDKPCSWLVSRLEIVDIAAKEAEEAEEAALRGR